MFALIEAQLSLLQEYTTVNDAIENIDIAADGAAGVVGNHGSNGQSLEASSSFRSTSSLHIKNIAISSILSNITEKQMTYRHTFLRTFESCIAASNDFMKMSNMLQDVMEYHISGQQQGEENEEFIVAVQQLVSILIQRFTNDAVYSCERAIMFIVNNIQDSNIPHQLFSHEWEDEFTHNQIMISIIDTIEDYLVDMKTYLEDPYLYSKAIITCLRSAICFYVQCFINKANKLRGVLSSTKVKAYTAFVPGGKSKTLQKVISTSFLNPKRAICRMKYDIQILQEYFERTTNSAARNSTIAVLRKAVEKELSVFVILMECMELAVATHHASSSMSSSDSSVSSSNNSLEELVFVVHKRTGGNVHVTQNFLSDLWLLFGGDGGGNHHESDKQHRHHYRHSHKVVETTILSMHNDLQRMTLALREADGNRRQQQPTDDDDVNAHYHLNTMLEHFYQNRQISSLSGCGLTGTTTAMVVQEAKHIANNLIHLKSPLKV